MVAAFFIAGIILWGMRFSFGVFFKSIEADFGLTRATTSMVFSVSMFLGGVFSASGGWAVDRYGPKIVMLLMGLCTGLSLLLTSQTDSLWQLFITYSLLFSMGTSAVYSVVMATVSRWFDKKRGLALGIAGSGLGLGMVVMAPLTTFLISTTDWRMAYLIIGLITLLVMTPLSRLFIKEPHDIGERPDGLKSNPTDTSVPRLKHEGEAPQPTSLSLLQALRTRSFWVLLFIVSLVASCLFLITTHLVPHVTDIGISAAGAAALLSLLGMATTAGRVLLGTVSDRVGRKRVIIICSLLQVGAMLWLNWSRDLWMLELFALVYGFAYGGISPSVAALTGDAFGLRNIGIILGILDIGWGIGAAAGPAIGGLIFDVTRSYSLAFLIGAATMLIVTLLVTPVRRETDSNFPERMRARK